MELGRKADDLEQTMNKQKLRQWAVDRTVSMSASSEDAIVAAEQLVQYVSSGKVPDKAPMNGD